MVATASQSNLKTSTEETLLSPRFYTTDFDAESLRGTVR